MQHEITGTFLDRIQLVLRIAETPHTWNIQRQSASAEFRGHQTFLSRPELTSFAGVAVAALRSDTHD
jgi:hypothetical protein